MSQAVTEATRSAPGKEERVHGKIAAPSWFYVLRFLLGAVEAGLFPGVILCLNCWLPAERCGKIIALVMTGIPASSIIGEPPPGWILQALGGAAGWSGRPLTLATVGVLSTLSQFWRLPTALLAGAATATGTAVSNSVGNLAGLVSPCLIGRITDQTRSTALGAHTPAACIAVGGLIALAMPKRLINC